MRRGWIAAALLVMALLLTGAALAETPEGPVNPYWKELEEHSRVENPLIAALRGSAWSHTVTLKRTRAGKPLSYTIPEVWQVTAVKDAAGNTCDLAGFRFEFIFGEYTSTLFGDSWVVYWQRTSGNSTFNCCSIVAPGEYRLKVRVYDADTEAQVYEGDYKYVANEDADHPTLEALAAQIAAEQAGATDWETALNLYDWVMSHTVYDNNLNYYGADGTLVRGTGVCDSYSKAYHMLLRAAGIEAFRISSQGHAWNALCLDGQWYQTDPTWDDSDGAAHEFFCITDALMLASGHNYSPSSARVCDSLAMNYFVQRGGWGSWNTAFLDTLYDAVLDGRGGAGTIAHNSTSSKVHRHMTILSYILSNQRQWYEDITDKNLAFTYSSGNRVFTVAVTDGHEVSGSWVYTPLGDDRASVAGFMGTATAVTVPAAIDGRTITGIDACAFRNHAALRTLNVPSTLVSVGRQALEGCDALQGLTLPAGVTDIGTDALPTGTLLTCGQDTALARALGAAEYSFLDAAYPGWLLYWLPGEPWALEGISLDAEALQLTVPACVTALTGISSDGLQMLYAGSQVTDIGAEVTPPASLLAVVTQSGSTAAQWAAAEGLRVLYTDRQAALPAVLNVIGDGAYEDTALSWVILPDSVTAIGAGAFANCDNLTAVTVPAGVSQIDATAFAGSPVLLLVTAGSPAEAWAQANGVPHVVPAR